jgi:hypothetical protein
MNGSGAFRAAVLAALLGAAPLAFACGYDDPNSATFQRGALNLSYPNALHVLGALTQARLDGLIGSEPEAAARNLFALNRTARMLQRFGEGLRPGPESPGDFAVSLLLIEPMLWTRFTTHDGAVSTAVHVNGPQPGDLVVVSAEAVLRQIVEHRLTARRAEELGLMRLYGDAAMVMRFRKLTSEVLGGGPPAHAAQGLN